MPALALMMNVSPFGVKLSWWKYRLDPPPSPDSRRVRCPVAGSIQSADGIYAREAKSPGPRTKNRLIRKPVGLIAYDLGAEC
jgi:hypothetical protein